MAIDTRDKRASAIACTVSMLLVIQQPDGSISSADRQHVGGWIYRGIAAAAPGGSPPLVVLERSSSRRVFGRIFGRVN